MTSQNSLSPLYQTQEKDGDKNDGGIILSAYAAEPGDCNSIQAIDHLAECLNGDESLPECYPKVEVHCSL
jgi:hypothetical protein